MKRIVSSGGDQPIPGCHSAINLFVLPAPRDPNANACALSLPLKLILLFPRQVIRCSALPFPSGRNSQQIGLAQAPSWRPTPSPRRTLLLRRGAAERGLSHPQKMVRVLDRNLVPPGRIGEQTVGRMTARMVMTMEVRRRLILTTISSQGSWKRNSVSGSVHRLLFLVSVFYSLYLFFELLYRTKSRCFLPLLKELPLRLTDRRLDLFVFCFCMYHTPFLITSPLHHPCLPYYLCRRGPCSVPA